MRGNRIWKILIVLVLGNGAEKCLSALQDRSPMSDLEVFTSVSPGGVQCVVVAGFSGS
jgi:hypothetical protein